MMIEQRGHRFEPRLFDLFIGLLDEMEAIRTPTRIGPMNPAFGYSS